VTDAGLSRVAGKLYLDLSTTSCFKGVILAEISAEELEVLAEMISDEDLVGKPSHSTAKCDIS